MTCMRFESLEIFRCERTTALITDYSTPFDLFAVETIGRLPVPFPFTHSRAVLTRCIRFGVRQAALAPAHENHSVCSDCRRHVILVSHHTSST